MPAFEEGNVVPTEKFTVALRYLRSIPAVEISPHQLRLVPGKTMRGLENFIERVTIHPKVNLTRNLGPS